ncbi:hypothetical protein NUW58_g6283 [Xylaria curta]|uniref:Uncharacterized protein n=1 Tax=Xylaria curta TaxID=42375 RepID=A0ACC1NWF7_9PEZI|nr:hypothetical protein NUW58_g6283 [Xylaria curta]
MVMLRGGGRSMSMSAGLTADTGVYVEISSVLAQVVGDIDGGTWARGRAGAKEYIERRASFEEVRRGAGIAFRNVHHALRCTLVGDFEASRYMARETPGRADREGISAAMLLRLRFQVRLLGATLDGQAKNSAHWLIMGSPPSADEHPKKETNGCRLAALGWHGQSTGRARAGRAGRRCPWRPAPLALPSTCHPARDGVKSGDSPNRLGRISRPWQCPNSALGISCRPPTPPRDAGARRRELGGSVRVVRPRLCDMLLFSVSKPAFCAMEGIEGQKDKEDKEEGEGGLEEFLGDDMADEDMDMEE